MLNLAEVWGLRRDGTNPCRHVPKLPACRTSARSVNALMTASYWEVGRSETLSRKSGDGLLIENSQTVSRKFDLSELAQAFTLPWLASVRLLSVKDDQARQFYETEALRGGWSVRQAIEHKMQRGACIVHFAGGGQGLSAAKRHGRTCRPDVERTRCPPAPI